MEFGFGPAAPAAITDGALAIEDGPATDPYILELLQTTITTTTTTSTTTATTTTTASTTTATIFLN